MILYPESPKDSTNQYRRCRIGMASRMQTRFMLDKKFELNQTVCRGIYEPKTKAKIEALLK